MFLGKDPPFFRFQSIPGLKEQCAVTNRLLNNSRSVRKRWMLFYRRKESRNSMKSTEEMEIYTTKDIIIVIMTNRKISNS